MAGVIDMRGRQLRRPLLIPINIKDPLRNRHCVGEYERSSHIKGDFQNEDGEDCSARSSYIHIKHYECENPRTTRNYKSKMFCLCCCEPAADMLLLYCYCASGAGPLLGYHCIAALSCCFYCAAALLLFYFYFIAALLLLCCCSAAALLLLCCCSAAALLLLCCCSATALLLICCCFAAAWLLLCCCFAAALLLLCSPLCRCFAAA